MRSSEAARLVGVAVLLVVLGSACTVGRRYVGSEIQTEPSEWIVIGKTTRAEVLGIFGPPDRILRQTSGDVFLYRYEQRNWTILSLEEPVITNWELFRWEKVQEKSNRLTVFFDREGVVSAYGFRRGRAELQPL